jgi:methionyl-tRNA formyltransferase
MIPKFLTSNLKAKKQTGNIVNFKRRTPSQSDINTLENKSIDKLYDFIRMLDGEGYPKAYIKFDNLKIEFSEVDKKNNKLTGRFEVIIDE